eukprot:11730072-Karenia_brevis.AAC.1
MALDSSPVFQAKLREFKLDELWEHFAARGWHSVATFAFSANYVPGNPDDSAFTNEVVMELLGSDTHPLKPALRRLFFDCYTMVAADAQRRAVGVEDDAKPRKLPGPERQSRLKAIRELLAGLG